MRIWRGRRKQQVQRDIQDVRRTVVNVRRRNSCEGIQDFRVQTVQRYKDTHNQHTPEQDGQTISKQWVDGILQDAVLLLLCGVVS